MEQSASVQFGLEFFFDEFLLFFLYVLKATFWKHPYKWKTYCVVASHWEGKQLGLGLGSRNCSSLESIEEMFGSVRFMAFLSKTDGGVMRN